MTQILILFGTTEGHTAKVARFLGGELGALGADVDVIDAATADPDPEGYEGVLVAGSLHARGYQPSIVRWARAHADALDRMPSAFVSVCLGVLQQDVRVIRALDAIVERFGAATGWSPERVKLVAGALPYTRYGWFKRHMMRRIVRQAGGDTDMSRDYEYTDWNDLRVFARTFYAECAPARPKACGGGASACVCATATIED
jgi:menaquinone-dependent protoporphyrinogen oxidase